MPIVLHENCNGATPDVNCLMSNTSEAALARKTWYQKRRFYRQMRHKKASDFWRSCMQSERSDPKRLWRSVDRLIGRGRLAASTSISANEYCHYFSNKVDAVRRAAANSPPPTFTLITSSSSMSTFRSTTVDEVSSSIRRLPDKSSAANPIPNVLKDVADLVAP